MVSTHLNHDKNLERLYDELYETHGKPLEFEHKGKYLAVSPKGRTVMGKSLLEVTDKAIQILGPGNFRIVVKTTFSLKILLWFSLWRMLRV